MAECGMVWCSWWTWRFFSVQLRESKAPTADVSKFWDGARSPSPYDLAAALGTRDA